MCALFKLNNGKTSSSQNKKKTSSVNVIDSNLVSILQKSTTNHQSLPVSHWSPQKMYSNCLFEWTRHPRPSSQTPTDLTFQAVWLFLLLCFCSRCFLICSESTLYMLMWGVTLKAFHQRNTDGFYCEAAAGSAAQLLETKCQLLVDFTEVWIIFCTFCGPISEGWNVRRGWWYKEVQEVMFYQVYSKQTHLCPLLNNQHLPLISELLGENTT